MHKLAQRAAFADRSISARPGAPTSQRQFAGILATTTSRPATRAAVFVADLVGLSVARELGPLMTAIIVCGRSGASFAAELGTMKVSEEIDALRTMGFGPIRYLGAAARPRPDAGPSDADTARRLGGDSWWARGGDIEPRPHHQRLSQRDPKGALRMGHFSGVLKSVVFALAISLIACQQGFATTGGAEGVGRRTTSSVVSILFALILLDAAFTVLFFLFRL